MRNTIGLALGLVAVIVLALGCQPQPTQPVGPAPDQVTVHIHYGSGKEPVRRFVTVPGRPTVLHVTRQVAPVRTRTTMTGETWVTGIAGVMTDVGSGRLWAYELNNSAPTTPPNLQHVAPGDVIRWRLE